MQKWFVFLFLILGGIFSYSQEIETPYKKKKIKPTTDTLFLEKTSINNSFFSLSKTDGTIIDTSYYSINFQKATLILKNKSLWQDTLVIRYLNFPEFLTKTYSLFDESRIVPNSDNALLISAGKQKKNTFKPFEGLNTTGSISRGITIGNNQNAVVNSNLDLQIAGKISENVSLRASIQDNNIPLQEGGYSQRLDEFDQIFIEIEAKNWKIRAGDLFLENRTSQFLNFNKKVQGLATTVNFGEKNKTSLFASASLVRGQYARSTFTGQEGNQGPYKLRGNNGELFVLIISGSERVYVNGILLQRGENNQYIIDYNAGEIVFTSLFPITSEMRINIEYQYAERNYTRFVTYGGATHTQKKWSIAGYLYAESDLKNQPLQQNLSQEQVAVLQNAGDNLSLMNAPSAFEDTFSENKILYRKTVVNGVEVFQFSNNPNDVLFNVRFTFVGANQGNYVLANNQAVGRIYEYVAPINGVLQGNYEPIIRLIPPTKIQVATVMGTFNPKETTQVDFEMAVSNNDLNLFSTLNDENNQGIAARLKAKQILFAKKNPLEINTQFQFISKDYRAIERLFAIEFNRDWNITTPINEDNQSLFTTQLLYKISKKGTLSYGIEKLDFGNAFSGIRHLFGGNIITDNWMVQSATSFMKKTSVLSNSHFARSTNTIHYKFGKNKVGSTFNMEDVSDKINQTQTLTPLTQRFYEGGVFAARGDSTKVFAEVGTLFRVNDSLQNNSLQRVNHSVAYYLKARPILNKTRSLSVFINYRTLYYTDRLRQNEPSLNARLIYNEQLFNQKIAATTTLETLSGTLPQQEFTYLEVEPGLGVYLWNDYNGNGIQELQEFEIAPFPDQAKYIRVFLPNQIFIRSNQNRFSQTITLNPQSWQNEKGIKKFLSLFYNQFSFLAERKIRREGSNFDINPFASSRDEALGITTSLRNSLFYNRGKQDHSVTYTFLSNIARNLLQVGLIENQSKSHQLQYLHLLKKSWLCSFFAKTIYNTTFSETFPSRNFEITGIFWQPKISYLFTKSTSLDAFFEQQNKQNKIGNLETLQQTRIGLSFTLSGKKQFTMNGEFALVNNQYKGNALSAVGFQMLEGLQPGKNQTWRLLLQKSITQFLDINLNYQGRTSEGTTTIHTGNVQLRAFF